MCVTLPPRTVSSFDVVRRQTEALQARRKCFVGHIWPAGHQLLSTVLYYTAQHLEPIDNRRVKRRALLAVQSETREHGLTPCITPSSVQDPAVPLALRVAEEEIEAWLGDVMSTNFGCVERESREVSDASRYPGCEQLVAEWQFIICQFHVEGREVKRLVDKWSEALAGTN
ncbi:unnamed protein product [Timema podura]|uniref:Uncharacterized protein n=1 Tax=Timema podura TaxID=61482 RepID=A0ABN7NUP6_TIMPD|nr:unnamed protein product [Timema podura]